MTVRAVRKIRKEMDMQQQPLQTQVPSNDAPMPPQVQPQVQVQPQQQPQVQEIPDHTHPEYDQMMVKIQELEGDVDKKTMGGIEQENNFEGDKKQFESYVRKMIREELKGVPEREIGKKQDSAGPDNTQEIPASTQPANGEAPSGGEFDSDDKTNKEDGDETESDTPKPKGQYDKLPIQKNKMNLAKKYIERAKKLMAEANGEDPTQPNPGAEEKDPKKMDGSAPNKSPMGGTEELGDDASEDPEANVPNKMRPDMKENVVDKVFRNLNREIRKENSRQSVVGMSSLSNERTQAAHEEFISNKQKVTNTVKEYLQKAGHNGALGHMGQRY